MTGVLIGFVITLLIPLFVGTWRVSVLGLAIQGALLATIALRRPDLHLSAGVVVMAVDLVVLRALALPFVLHRVLLRQNAPPRNDETAPNLFSWAMALALVVVAFRTADVLVPAEGDEQMLVAASSAALLLGLFVLATARGTMSQIVGLMRVENAIALFELGRPVGDASLAIHIGQTAILLVSFGFYRWYLVGLSQDEPVAAATETL
jgi:hydrogenase-4 component E